MKICNTKMKICIIKTEKKLFYSFDYSLKI